ncbi:MAG: DUF721 domain-containing protein [Balneolaceae bacterium]
MAYSSNPQPLEQLLKKFMKNVPQRDELKRGMVLHFWREVVGEQVANATRDLSFEKNNLAVKVESEAWRHEVHMSRYSIKKKLNDKVGSAAIKEIIVRC